MFIVPIIFRTKLLGEKKDKLNTNSVTKRQKDTIHIALCLFFLLVNFKFGYENFI
jgi:hypothetical protein